MKESFYLDFDFNSEMGDEPRKKESSKYVEDPKNKYQFLKILLIFFRCNLFAIKYPITLNVNLNFEVPLTAP